MLADSTGAMPDSLRIEADQRFFERGLDGVDVVVHGRGSHEHQSRSHLRRRLIVTRQVAAIAADVSNAKALFWNPAGAPSNRPWPLLGRRVAVLESLAARMYSGCSWTATMFSIYRVHPMCGWPACGRSFRSCPY